MLQKILAVVARPPVPLVAGTLLLTAVVWFGGELLRAAAGWPPRALTVVLSVLVPAGAAAFVALRTLRARQKARAIEQEIRAQARAQAEASPMAGRADDIAALQQRFDEALDALKGSKLGRGALYALPWYVIIGPPGSGKTTAITESGLNFPFLRGPGKTGQKRGIRGLGGTRNCDWWFTDQAILLDTAGRYTTEAEDRDEWLAFLGMIKRARKLKPINGVMVAISIADVLTAGDDGLESHAETIRQRIDELVKHLEVVFPVYLVFTKCDLMDGFVEFFAGLSKDGRGQVWGATFAAGAPDDAPLQERFFAAFDRLYGRIDLERLRLLVPDRPSAQQRKIFSLALQLRAARRRLGEFVGLLTQPNPYSEGSPLRGFYFTSGTQEGAPIDQVLQRLTAAHGLRIGDEQAKAEPVEAKSYFVRDLFTKVMVADRDLARSSAAVQRRREWTRRAVLAGSALAVVVFGAMAISGYASTAGLLGDMQAAIDRAAAHPVAADRSGPPSETAQAALELLRDGYLSLEAAYSPTSVLGPGRDSVDRAMAAYADALQPVFLQPIAARLERELREFAAAPQKERTLEVDALLQVYRALDWAPGAEYVGPARLVELIAGRSLWKWDPQEILVAAPTVGTSPASRHLEAYAAARERHPAVWAIATDKQLAGTVAQLLSTGGHPEYFIRRHLQDNPDALRASEEDLRATIGREIEQRLPAVAGTLTREQIDAKASALRQQIVLGQLAGLGVGRHDSLHETVASLADIDREDGPLLQTFRSCISTLRQAGALPADGGDAVAAAYLACLQKIASLRPPVQALLADQLLGDRILADLRDGDGARLRTFREQLTEVRRFILQQLEAIKGSSGHAAEPLRLSLTGMLDAIADGVAREARREMQQFWDTTVGKDLQRFAERFPFQPTSRDDVARSEFVRLFAPRGGIDRALMTLTKVQGLRELGKRIEVSDRFEDLRRAIAAIQATFFAEDAPDVPRLRFRISGMEKRAQNIQDLVFVIDEQTRVGIDDDASAAMRANVERRWRVGDLGSRCVVMLTNMEDGQNVQVAVPGERNPDLSGRTDPSSEWGFLRLLATAARRELPNSVEFEWTFTHRLRDDPNPVKVRAMVALKPDGTHNPFGAGFFALDPNVPIFKAEAP